MPYNVIISDNADDDLAAMPPASRRQVLRAIHERLTVSPLLFGKRLRHSLRGLRSLRVGDYRVGYMVDGESVVIAHIDLRRDAYKDW